VEVALHARLTEQGYKGMFVYGVQRILKRIICSSESTTGIITFCMCECALRFLTESGMIQYAQFSP